MGEFTTFCYIHKCKSRKKKIKETSNMRLQGGRSLEIPMPVREHLKLLFEFMTLIWCQVTKTLLLVIHRNATSGLSQGAKYFHSHTSTGSSWCLSSSTSVRWAWQAEGGIWGWWTGKNKVVCWREAWYRRIWLAGCKLHCVVKAHPSHSSVRTLWNWNWELLSHWVMLPFSLTLYSHTDQIWGSEIQLKRT